MFVITAIVVGVSVPAFAQGGSGQPAAAIPPAIQAAAASSTQAVVVTSPDPRNWMATGYIGSNFGSSRSGTADLNLSRIENLDTNNSTSANYGFQVAYLGRGVIGGFVVGIACAHSTPAALRTNLIPINWRIMLSPLLRTVIDSTARRALPRSVELQR